ncbi:CocE/NonD family hydrolase [Terrimonas sp. NA20]|uniref:CocE/NonD family hydrolase n=1 Tax=Terrimonas ginsenosidimutans TaxID=2908004 RepID=A0ABS9KTU3_9BACT|nr:CocE/NonD family hydrolase [Terrimonas ginsenosidimutans]MCG2615751.1 CocE/NonD family hydrolase [Terrimonas ginsenosidimutans]
MRLHSVLAIIYCYFSVSVSAQQNWSSIQQPVPVKDYAGKKFKFSLTARTDGSSDVVTLVGAQVTRKNGEWGYFNSGVEMPVTDSSWTSRSIEGVIDADAETLNLVIVCMGNGAGYYDNAKLQIEETPGLWKQILLTNAGFEESPSPGKLPAGWIVGRASSQFTFHTVSGNAPEGKSILSITGIGNVDLAGVTFMRKSAYAKQHYVKKEFYVPMRDGVKLFTAVYIPKAASSDQKFPFMLHRTPYGIGPYGTDMYPFNMAPGNAMMEEGYIFVHQDVRGRFKSEGIWQNMTPHIPVKSSQNDVDESTDTWDTIDWLLKNIQHNNGKAGQWGISYPGFYAAAGSIDAHPALKAVSPQAPVADFFFDDFHHNGAFVQAYFPFFPLVGSTRKEPTDHPWFQDLQRNTDDSYDFFKRMGTVKQAADSLLKENILWKQMTSHPDYDTFWKKRRITDHYKNLKPAYLIVGGWYDAEDLYGTLATYKGIEQNNKGIFNSIVMGPFGHGDWAKDEQHTMQHQIYYGDSISGFYQRNIEAKFFHHYLKTGEQKAVDLPEAYMFDTGVKEWKTFSSWPAVQVTKKKLHLGKDGLISLNPSTANGFSEYISDPAKPVPYTMDVPGSFGITPRNYMNEDQRFAASRPDVIVFETPVLENDLTLGGEITVNLQASTTGTDADWVVKLIDVYPPGEQNTPYTPRNVSLGGYQQLVRGDVMRSRWRNSFERPEPVIAGKPTKVTFKLQDVLHTFKKGHRVMVQVQSTWFPLIDINPQKFVPNIYKAEKKDFIKAVQRVHYGSQGSFIEVDVLQ